MVIVLTGSCQFPVVLSAALKEYKISHITSADGLGHGFVYTILEDSKGCMWFGTHDGLGKYDGLRFRSYRRLPRDTNSLSHHTVKVLAEDHAGYIWVGCGNHGLNRLNRFTGKSRRFFHDPDDPRSISHNSIRSLYVDAQGKLWVGTDRGLNRYDPATEEFERVGHRPDDPQGLQKDSIDFIGQSSSGDFWLTNASDVIIRFSPEDGSFEKYCLPGTFGDSPDIISLLADSLEHRRRDALSCLGILNTILWCEGYFGFEIDRPEMPGEKFFREKGLLYQYAEMPQGEEYWIIVLMLNSRMNGIYYVREQSQEQPELVARDYVHTFLRDSHGICWIGGERGVYKATPVNKHFTTYTHDPDDTTSLSHPRIRSILADSRGELWVGADYGLNRLVAGTKEWRHYVHDPRNVRGISNSTVNEIFEEKDGTLLFGSNYGLNVYDRDKDAFSMDFGRPYEGGPLLVWSICRDSSGNLWVGSHHNGIWLYDSNNVLRRRLRQIPGDSSSLSDDHVWCLHTDSDGSVWAGTENGLSRWLPDEERFKRYVSRAGDPGSLCGNNIWAIHKSADASLWFAADGSGVSRMLSGSDSFTSLVYGDPLPSEGVYAVLSDKAGNMWIASNAGLSLYDPGMDSLLYTYDGVDGLQKGQFSYKAYFKAPDGELFFGGHNGLSRFFPEQIGRNLKPPAVLLSSFSINDSVALHEVADGSHFKLNYDQNDLAFEFAALSYTNSARNTCEFMLEGQDETWQTGPGRRFASYPNLSPGEYDFRVRGANSDNVWSEHDSSVRISIEPPYWQAIWFRMTAFAMVTGLLLGGYWFRLRELRRRHSLERQALEAQLQALRAQMNPHFIFNSLTSIHSLLLDEEHETASDYLTNFARLTRMTLEYSRRAFISLREELHFLDLYLKLEATRFQGRIRYSVDVDEAIQAADLSLPPMMIQPLVENAIHHGLLPKSVGGELRLAFRLSGAKLICIVEDDGIGRKRADQLLRPKDRKRPLGLAVNHERMRILNKQHIDAELKIEDLSDVHGLACGTRVRLSIAVQAAAD